MVDVASLRSFSLLCLGLVSTWLGHQLVCTRLSKMSRDERERYRIPLSDVGHLWLPSLERHRWVSDTITMGFQLAMLTIGRLRLPSLLGMAGWMYTMRAICFSVTLLPNCRHIPIDPTVVSTWSRATHGSCRATWRLKVVRWWSDLLRIEQSFRTDSIITISCFPDT